MTGFLSKLCMSSLKTNVLGQFNPKGDPHFSALFYKLLRECWKKWRELFDGNRYKFKKEIEAMEKKDLLDVSFELYLLPKKIKGVDLGKYQQELDFIMTVRESTVNHYLKI